MPGGAPPAAPPNEAAPAGDLEARVRSALRRAGRVTDGTPVLVALSGGLDSVVLLHLLRFPLRDLGLRVRAAHLDHAMRPDSAADAAWVRGLCTAWRVPVDVERADPPPRSEAGARRARYAFLHRVAGPHTRILTAHHRGDQAETVLLNASRGTGLRGLRGIAPRRGAVLRPLLDAPRAEILGYARRTGLAWRLDATNLDLRLRRNRIRHRVLPAMEAARPGTEALLVRLARAARRWETRLRATLDAAEDRAIVERDDHGVTLARPVLQAYHPRLGARLLRRVLRRYGSTPDRAGTHAALEFISAGPSGGEFHVRGGVRIERDFDRIRIQRSRGARRPDRPLVIADARPGSGHAVIGGARVRVSWRPAPADRESAAEPGGAGETGTSIVVQAPVFPLTVRGWRPGDRIRFGYGRKKVKKLWPEHRLDRRARRRVPVVADGAGAVVWVVGLVGGAGTAGAGPGLQITVEHARQR